MIAIYAIIILQAVQIGAHLVHVWLYKHHRKQVGSLEDKIDNLVNKPVHYRL